MFSRRLVAVFGLAVLAVVTAYPYPASDREVIPQPVTTITEDDFAFPWMSISPFSLFAPLWKLIPSFADIGPRIYADDDKFQVVVNAKDYRKDDLKVKVKGDFIFVQGSQEAKQDERDVFASQFFHTYTLPANASSEDVKAELTSDGYLVITAPINGDVDKSKDSDREVPIVYTGSPYKREKKVQKATEDNVEAASSTAAPITNAPTSASTTAAPTAAPTTAASTTVAASTTTTAAPVEDKEEATTPPEPEEVTEKDNVIPHGNDVAP
ncbi:alpha-crystallin B chain [Manduca sexta]|nr:alpha-crystallin B chain [Manduca sexta]